LLKHCNQILFFFRETEMHCRSADAHHPCAAAQLLLEMIFRSWAHTLASGHT
jgi:hypothetical protein